MTTSRDVKSTNQNMKGHDAGPPGGPALIISDSKSNQVQSQPVANSASTSKIKKAMSVTASASGASAAHGVRTLVITGDSISCAGQNADGTYFEYSTDPDAKVIANKNKIEIMQPINKNKDNLTAQSYGQYAHANANGVVVDAGDISVSAIGSRPSASANGAVAQNVTAEAIDPDVSPEVLALVRKFF